jgi:hypothetical protein
MHSLQASITLPTSLAPAFAEFGLTSAGVGPSLLRESFEFHVGAAATALGVGKGFLLGNDAKALVDLGTRLMAFNWPALPNFNKVGGDQEHRGCSGRALAQGCRWGTSRKLGGASQWTGSGRGRGLPPGPRPLHACMQVTSPSPTVVLFRGVRRHHCPSL